MCAAPASGWTGPASGSSTLIPRPAAAAPRPEHPGPGNPDSQPRANLTDPDSTIMPTKHGWVQG